MAGKVVVSTLNNDTGVLATQNGMTGIAKAWCNFNGTGTVAIRASFNVSSITDNGTGDYTVNFTNALVDANYAVTVTTSSAVGWIGSTRQDVTAPTTSAVRIACFTGAGVFADENFMNVAIFSS